MAKPVIPPVTPPELIGYARNGRTGYTSSTYSDPEEGHYDEQEGPVGFTLNAKEFIEASLTEPGEHDKFLSEANVYTWLNGSFGEMADSIIPTNNAEMNEIIADCSTDALVGVAPGADWVYECRHFSEAPVEECLVEGLTRELPARSDGRPTWADKVVVLTASKQLKNSRRAKFFGVDKELTNALHERLRAS